MDSFKMKNWGQISKRGGQGLWGEDTSNMTNRTCETLGTEPSSLPPGSSTLLPGQGGAMVSQTGLSTWWSNVGCARTTCNLFSGKDAFVSLRSKRGWYDTCMNSNNSKGLYSHSEEFIAIRSLFMCVPSPFLYRPSDGCAWLICHTCRNQGLQCCSSSGSVLKQGSHTGTWGLWILLGCLSSQHHGSTHPHLPGTGITMHTVIRPHSWIMGIELGCACLHGKYSYCLSHFPSPH